MYHIFLEVIFYDHYSSCSAVVFLLRWCRHCFSLCLLMSSWCSLCSYWQAVVWWCSSCSAVVFLLRWCRHCFSLCLLMSSWCSLCSYWQAVVWWCSPWCLVLVSCPRFGDNKKGNENLILPCFCWRQ